MHSTTMVMTKMNRAVRPTLSFLLLLLTLATTTAFQPSHEARNVNHPPLSRKEGQIPFVSAATAIYDVVKEATARASVTAALTAAVLWSAATPLPAAAAVSTNSNPEAAQISLNNLPPSSVSIQIKDLPVIGNLISGTYTKVADGTISQPSVVIKSPVEKVKAIKDLATQGHLEFDVNGILSTHFDVDVAADEQGILRVRVASNVIPLLPYKNLASAKASSPTGGRPSPWNMVTNMGSGETYYYNEKSGVTQYNRPDGF